MPPGIHQYSVVVSTPQREMKFTAPTKERHDIWINVSQIVLLSLYHAANSLLYFRPYSTSSRVQTVVPLAHLRMVW